MIFSSQLVIRPRTMFHRRMISITGITTTKRWDRWDVYSHTAILKVTGVNAEVQEHVKTRPAWRLNSSLWLFCGLVEKLLSCKSFHVYVCINRWWRWSTKNVPTSPEYTTSEKALKGWRCMQWRSQITLENTRQVVSKRARSINQTTLK